MRKLSNEQRQEIRKQMRLAHKAGKDVSLMATCAETYAIALKVKYAAGKVA